MRRVKKKDHENLSAANIQKVISLLQPENGTAPISKKEACEILNIAYNTTRLQKIIDDHIEHKEYVRKRKAMNRGRPATNDEISDIVTGYLRGEALQSIASGIYRSTAFVKNVIETVGVPSRNVEEDWKADILPEACIAEEFAKGEIVWSAKYHSAAIVENEMSVDYQAEKPGYHDVNYEKKYSSKCYSIYVITKPGDDDDLWASKRIPGFYAYSLAYDLGKLEHLKEYGVRLEDI